MNWEPQIFHLHAKPDGGLVLQTETGEEIGTFEGMLAAFEGARNFRTSYAARLILYDTEGRKVAETLL